jgi:hypothetical protein
MTEREIQNLLVEIDGQRLEGPNSAGAYLIAVKPSSQNRDMNALLASLRNRADIRLAEPVFQ